MSRVLKDLKFNDKLFHSLNHKDKRIDKSISTICIQFVKEEGTLIFINLVFLLNGTLGGLFYNII